MTTCNHDAFRSLGYLYCPVCGVNLNNEEDTTPVTTTIDRNGHKEPWAEYYDKPITMINRCKWEYERRKRNHINSRQSNYYSTTLRFARANDYLDNIKDYEVDPLDFAEYWFGHIWQNEENAINQIWEMKRLLDLSLPETFTTADVKTVMNSVYCPSLVTMLRYGIVEEVGIRHNGFITLHFGKRVEMTSKIYRISNYAWDMWALYREWKESNNNERIRRYQRIIDNFYEEVNYKKCRINYYESLIEELR